MSSFSFKVSEIFTIIGRGIVFRGVVEKGIVSEGDTVSFKTKEKNISATITFIEHNKKSIMETIQGEEIGLLLNEFNQNEINEIVNFNDYTDEEWERLPPIEERLKVELPLNLYANGM